MKPETIARRAAERVIEQAEQKADLRERLAESAAREEREVPEDLWIYAGPEGMLAEFDARNG
jgi:hypothetical protein